ncbi:MAG: amino acid ABC transporter permease [Candidatus Izemoplasmataceae bacterium]
MNVLAGIPQDFLGGTFYILKENYPLYIEGVKYTLLIATLGTLFGLLLSLFLTALRIQETSNKDGLKERFIKRFFVMISSSYVEFFRGTPMMVQAMIFFYGFARMGLRMPIIIAGLVVVSLNTAAYLTEVLRAGINGIDKGQMEAARAIGLSRAKALRYVVFPQALKNMLPAIGNELVVNIKDTAVLSVIGVSELFYMGKSVAGTYYRYTEAFVLVALVYLVIVIIMTRLLSFIVKKVNHKEVHLPMSQSIPIEVN